MIQTLFSYQARSRSGVNAFLSISYINTGKSLTKKQKNGIILE